MTSRQRLVTEYERANLEAAAIIVKDLAKYGDGGLMATWAQTVLRRHEQDQSDAGPLFRERAA